MLSAALQLSRSWLIPPALAHLLLTYADVRWLPLRICGYLLSVPLCSWLLGLPATRARAQDMQRLKAVPIPKVKGWLPGNIDILWKLVRTDQRIYCAEILRQWSEKYGPTYDMNILWAHQIVTVDPSNVQHVVATSFTNFEKSHKFLDMFMSFLGEGIFSTDGDLWKRHRAVAKPFFSRDRIQDFQCFERHFDNLLSLLETASGQAKPVDIQDYFARFSMDVATDMLFGNCVHSLDAVARPNASYDRFVRAFNRVCAVGATRVRIGSNWKLFELTGDRMAEPAAVVREFVDPILNAAVEKKGAVANIDEMNFLDYMLTQIDDIDLVRSELLNVLLAARDTTASLLTFTTYRLTQNPSATHRLREEIERVVGRDGRLTADAIKQMRYLRAFINEVLRLFPPVPMNIRRSIGSSALPSSLSARGALYMPARTSITYCPLLIHRRADLWGDDALVFKPERWLGDDLNAKTHVAHPFAFLPFNGGPRMCLGQQLAYTEVSFVIIRLLQHASRFTLTPEAQPEESRPPPQWAHSKVGREAVEQCWPLSSLTLYSKGGLWVTIGLRDDES